MTDLCSNTTWKGLHGPILVVMVSWQEDLVGLTSPVAVDDARCLHMRSILVKFNKFLTHMEPLAFLFPPFRTPWVKTTFWTLLDRTKLITSKAIFECTGKVGNH